MEICTRTDHSFRSSRRCARDFLCPSIISVSGCRWFIRQMLNCKTMISQTYATLPSLTPTPAVWEILSSTSVFAKLPVARDYFLYILFIIKSALSTYKLTTDIFTVMYTSGKSKMCHCLEDISRRLVATFCNKNILVGCAAVSL